MRRALSAYRDPRDHMPLRYVNRSLAAVFPALALLAPAAFCQASGSIAGTITGDDGKPVAVVVRAVHTAKPITGGNAQATTAGAFTIPNLEPGAYRICAAVEDLGYLDPCEWSLQPPTVQLAAGQAAKGVNIVVKKGGMLHVHVADPDKILGQTPALQQAVPGILLGVYTPRRLLRPLPLTNADGNGRDHQLLIPLDDTPAILYVSGYRVQISDHAGAEVAANGKQTSIAPRNGKAPDIVNLVVRDPSKHGQ